jgi:hypothetical protein
MRSIILASVLALGTLAFGSTPAAEAAPRGGHGGYHGGPAYSGYRGGYRGHYGSAYRGGYYGVRPYATYGYYQPVPVPVPVPVPLYGNGYYQSGYGY